MKSLRTSAEVLTKLEEGLELGYRVGTNQAFVAKDALRATRISFKVPTPLLDTMAQQGTLQRAAKRPSDPVWITRYERAKGEPK